MSEKSFDRLKTALDEVRDFYAGKGGVMKFHIPDGKGGFTTRELTHEQYCDVIETLPAPPSIGDMRCQTT